MESRFDLLTGVAYVDADAPESWRDLAVLPFWETVCDPSYDPRLPRPLMHESLHFWQLMWSGYLMSLVEDEWQRLVRFETVGALDQASARVKRHNDRNLSPFCPDDLVEAWCRYWDVHIRGPHRVLEEDGLARPGGPSREGMYSSRDFDTAMLEGPSARLYARPYRWLLDYFAGESATCNALFPFLVAVAFLTDDPTAAFADGATALHRPDLADTLQRQHTETGETINMTWLEIAGPMLQAELLKHVGAEPRLGADLLGGPLASHPLLSPYAVKAAKSNFKNWTSYFFPSEPSPRRYLDALVRFSREAPVIAQQVMPGQPWYRSILGALIPPPAIQFRNFTWFAPLILNIEIDHGSGSVAYTAKGDHTFGNDFADVVARRARFSAAQQEAALGLPLGSLSPTSTPS